MSLTVSPQLLDQARHGEVDDDAFVACIRTSLPYAYDLIDRLVLDFRAGDQPFAADSTPPPDEHAQGQLLRLLASDAMRGALQRHFGVTIAFQNCCKAGVFAEVPDGDAYLSFVSPRAQLLNQSPALISC